MGIYIKFLEIYNRNKLIFHNLSIIVALFISSATTVLLFDLIFSKPSNNDGGFKNSVVTVTNDVCSPSNVEEKDIECLENMFNKSSMLDFLLLGNSQLGAINHGSKNEKNMLKYLQTILKNTI